MKKVNMRMRQFHTSLKKNDGVCKFWPPIEYMTGLVINRRPFLHPSPALSKAYLHAFRLHWALTPSADTVAI